MELTLERESKTPLYVQLTAQLTERITTGDWAPGHRLPSYKVMAEQLSVSSVTIIQAVDELARMGLVVRARGARAFVAGPDHKMDSSRRTELESLPASVQSTLNIGLFALLRNPDENWEWTDFFHEPLRLALHEAVSAEGGRVIPEPITWNFLESALENAADGVILSQVVPEPEKIARLKQLSDAGIPYVIVGGYYEDETLPCIGVDNAAGMEAAVRHLVDRGHRNIGFINLSLDGLDHHVRWRAFQKTMGELGIAIDLRLLLLRFNVRTYDDGVEAIRDWFTSGLPRCTAMIACSGMEGMAAMRVLSERGCSVPDDISLVSFDDSSAAALHNPGITVVRQPLRELGRRSVEKLIGAIRSGRMPVGTEILPTELIVRESTRAITS